MIIYYFIIINILTFLMYGTDKLKAIRHKQRIPEMVLLNLSLFGGCVGAVVGMVVFNHKTRKKLFIVGNAVCLILYMIVVYYFWRYM